MATDRPSYRLSTEESGLGGQGEDRSCSPTMSQRPSPALPSAQPPAALRLIDWIWHIRGRIALAPGQSSDGAFDKLTPLLNQPGTTHQRTRDTLTFVKTDQAAQDKLSVFDGGVISIDKGQPGPVFRYDLSSRALLACFLAPVLFLSLAQATIALRKFDNPPHEAAKKAAVRPLNPIDKALGAPAPDTTQKKETGASGGRGRSLSPRPAYTFAEIFAALYVVGRLLEDRLVKALFSKVLREP